MYRKFAAARLFTGYEWLDDSWVLVMDDTGVVMDVIPTKEAGNDVQLMDGTLCPGFVNSHCHLELSHLKGSIPKGTGMVEFVFQVLQKREAIQELVQDAMEIAENEMLAGGIVAVGDICNTSVSLPQKLKNRLYYHNFIETTGFVPAGAKARFENAKNVYDQFCDNGMPCSIVPHAPYSVSGDLFRLIADHPGNNMQSMHNQEAAAENEFFNQKSGDFLALYRKLNINIDFFVATGKNSLPSVLHHFKNFRRLILAHNVYSEENDIKMALEFFSRQPDLLSFCICTNANQYIGNGYPPLEKFMAHDCNIVVGTDSLASNDSLSVMKEIQTLQHQFKWLSWEECLKWATINGARALGIDDKFGSFTKGRQPGVLHLRNGEVQRLL